MSMFISVRNLRVLYALCVYRTYVPQVCTDSTCIYRSLSLYITLSILISQVHSGMIRQGSIEKFSYVTIQKSARNGSELSHLSGAASNSKKQSKSSAFTRPAGAPILSLSKGAKARSAKDRVGDKATDHQDTPLAPFKQTPDLWLADPPASSGLMRSGHSTGGSRSDPSPLAVLKEFMSVTNEEDQEGAADDDDDDDDDSEYDEDEEDDELEKDKESGDSTEEDEDNDDDIGDDEDDEDDDESPAKVDDDRPLTRSSKNIPHSSINHSNKDTNNNYADDEAEGDEEEEEEGDDGTDDLDEHEDYGEDVMFNNALSSSFAHKQPRSRGVKKLINRLIDEV